MKCGIVKKGLMVAGLSAAAMFLLFGSKAWHYTRYAARQVRDNVKASVPFDADLDAARQQVKALDPAINTGIEALAKLEENVKQLEGEVVALKSNLGEEGRKIQILRASLDDPHVHRTSASSSNRARETELARRLDIYKRAKYVLQVKEETLQRRQDLAKATYDQLMEMKAKKQALLSQIDEIEARHKSLEASQSFNEFNFDTSALAQAERAVNELSERVNVECRENELRAEFSEEPITSLEAASARDIRQEVDNEFGTASGNGSARTVDKDL